MMDREEPRPNSVWRSTVELTRYERLTDDAEADVCVIGGGITGLTAALLLAREGRDVVLVERHHLGHGVTGSTTAHITALVDADYGTLAKQLGLPAVREVYTAMAAAIDQIASLAADLEADCDFERVDAYYYAEPGGDTQSVRASLEALRAADLNVGRLEASTPLPFATEETLVLPHQATFHPLRYLNALAIAASREGVRIHENTPALRVTDGDPCVVELEEGRSVRAKHVFHATHSPAGISVLQAEMTNYRSYALAARVRKTVPSGLFFDTAQPYRYIRRHRIEGEELVLIGGADHKTGKGAPKEAMRSLERYARQRFDVSDIVARWSAQIYESSDGLPYIGWSPGGSHSIVATGFAGDGMVFGTLSAMIGTHLIVGSSDRWAHTFRPDRFHVRASTPRVLEKGLEVAKDFVFDRLNQAGRGLNDIPAGEGRVVRVKGQRLAVFKDDAGTVHARSAVCPHMKCLVHWNAFERSWDCPCHGSRFDVTGAVLEGPAMHDLQEVDLEGIREPAERS